MRAKLVAASADPALHVGLAGLVASRRQAEVRADVTRSSEAVWPVDRGAECERGERADARHGHQVSARGLDADFIEHPLREPGNFIRHDLGLFGQVGANRISRSYPTNTTHMWR